MELHVLTLVARFYALVKLHITCGFEYPSNETILIWHQQNTYDLTKRHKQVAYVTHLKMKEPSKVRQGSTKGANYQNKDQNCGKKCTHFFETFTIYYRLRNFRCYSICVTNLECMKIYLHVCTLGLIGASLSKPYTSMTTLHMCVYIRADWSEPEQAPH